MNSRRKTTGTFVAMIALALSTTAIADWEPDSGDRLQERAAKAVTRIKAKVERSQPFFDDAYAVAVWPGITRLAVGFGGAYGKGVVIEQDEAVGTVTYWQGSSGIQAGVKNFTLIIFFKDKESLDGLKRGDFQFTGQAGVDLVTFGASATPAYNQGVAIIALTNLGLMAEFSAAGTFFRFKRYDQ